MNHTNLRLLAVCAALAAPALASAPALAQQAQTLDAGTLARQRQLFDQGNKLYDQGKLAEAEAAYLGAWKLKKSFDVAGNLGNLEYDMKKWRVAAEFLSYALREFPAGGKPAMRDELIKRLGEVQKLVGQLRFRVNRPGAEVFVDGTSVGVAPIPNEVYVEPGTHLAEVRLDGFPTVQINVTAAKGRTEDVPVVLVAASANKGVIITGAVVAGAAAIAGGALLGISVSKGSAASTLYGQLKTKGCPPASSPSLMGDCATLKSDLDAKSSLGSAGVWMLVGAGVVGIGTLIYGVAGGGSRGSKSGLVVAPVVTADGGGVFAKGSF